MQTRARAKAQAVPSSGNPVTPWRVPVRGHPAWLMKMKAI